MYVSSLIDILSRRSVAVTSFAVIFVGCAAFAAQNPTSSPQGSPAPSGASAAATSTANTQNPAPSAPQPRPGLNIVVLDPAHGGTDTGARGMAGVRESEAVLDMTWTVRQSLERLGFQ